MDGILALARQLSPDLVFVAPDDPQAMGMVDMLEYAGFRAFGARKNAAIIEASKVFSKDLMRRYGIPTAKYQSFDDFGQAERYILRQGAPLWIKADGLALGKGAVYAGTPDEAIEIAKEFMLAERFGIAGKSIVIEECLSGPEVTVLLFCDGKTVKVMPSSQDHKRVFDNDQGPNTGGMGAFAPSPLYTPEIADITMRAIIQPTIDAMSAEGRPFKGVLYVGLMLCADGPKVIEYNARFGDPEAQAVLSLLKTDLMDIIDAVIDEKLDELDIKWENKAACCVVLASAGYPGEYATGLPIFGLDECALPDGVYVYHSGTRRENGQYVTAGGRVLGVTAVDDTLKTAIDKAYKAVSLVSFEGAHYRRDIGASYSETT